MHLGAQRAPVLVRRLPRAGWQTVAGGEVVTHSHKLKAARPLLLWAGLLLLGLGVVGDVLPRPNISRYFLLWKSRRINYIAARCSVEEDINTAPHIVLHALLGRQSNDAFSSPPLPVFSCKEHIKIPPFPEAVTVRASTRVEG